MNRKKILVADDEKEFVKMMKDFLTKRGQVVDVAYDGKEAQDLIKKNNYDVIFLDHNMPELTGLELIKHIKQNNLKSKIIMITGYPEMEEFFAKAIGADGYLEKPFRMQEVKKIINKMDKDA